MKEDETIARRLQINENALLRKSERQKKRMKKAMSSDLPQQVLSAIGITDDYRLPSGWNASDDSEEEYQSQKFKKK